MVFSKNMRIWSTCTNLFVTVEWIKCHNVLARIVIKTYLANHWTYDRILYLHIKHVKVVWAIEDSMKTKMQIVCINLFSSYVYWGLYFCDSRKLQRYFNTTFEIDLEQKYSQNRYYCQIRLLQLRFDRQCSYCSIIYESFLSD